MYTLLSIFDDPAKADALKDILWRMFVDAYIVSHIIWHIINDRDKLKE